MRILYLLDRPDLGGGVKVVMQHAALLARRGHRVWVVGRGPRPDWALPGEPPPGLIWIDWSHLPSHRPPALDPPPDLAVATYWTTLAPVAALEAGRRLHLCQGYEAEWPHETQRRGEIAAAYAAAPWPTWVVAPHLGELLQERHGRPWYLTSPPVDPRFHPRLPQRLRRRPRDVPRVAVPGIFEAEVKGVTVALDAVRRLAEAGHPCRLLRLSVLPESDEERSLKERWSLPEDRFLAGVGPEEVAEALASCDLLFFPSLPGEGFGLPLLEALASGVPAVSSDLPSTRFMAEGAASLVPPGDAGALAAAAAELLETPFRWREARRTGLEAAAHFAAGAVAELLEKAVEWARSEDWAREVERCASP